MNVSAPSRLFTVRDAALYLRISVQTVRSLIADGKLACIRTSPRAKVLLDCCELERFIQDNSTRREEV